jgi:hypothetical protein
MIHPRRQVGQYKRQLEAQGWVYEMEVSFVEIYNEQVRDLLRSLNPEYNKAAEVRACLPVFTCVCVCRWIGGWELCGCAEEWGRAHMFWGYGWWRLMV